MLRENEEKLLALLRLNARESISSLARKMGVSRTTVQSQLNKLESSGVIAGYRVKLGEKQSEGIQALVEIKVEPSRLAGVLSELKALTSIETLHTVSGKYDLVALVRADNANKIDEQLDKIGGVRGVTRTESAIILSTKLDRR